MNKIWIFFVAFFSLYGLKNAQLDHNTLRGNTDRQQRDEIGTQHTMAVQNSQEIGPIRSRVAMDDRFNREAEKNVLATNSLEAVSFKPLSIPTRNPSCIPTPTIGSPTSPAPKLSVSLGARPSHSVVVFPRNKQLQGLFQFAESDTSTNLMRSQASAPTNPPSSLPTVNPTIGPTAVAQATGYVSQYVYDTSTCTGVPNSITAYSLGVCFNYCSAPTYCYAMYSLGTPQAGVINLVLTYYTNSYCTIQTSSSAYLITKACTSGTSYNVSTSLPAAPQSFVTRCPFCRPCAFYSLKCLHGCVCEGIQVI